MEKLELKHIVGYLPYGLKGKVNVFADSETDVNIVGFNMDDECELEGIRLTVTEWWNISDIKPILRPLSDLTKEIEVNGEKFVPIDYLTKLCDLNTDTHELRFENLLFILYNKKEGFYQINDNNFSFFQKLYEWHFAINIPEHLYIDINTIKTN